MTSATGEAAVGMGVGGAHRRAAVLEDLDPAPVATQVGRLVGPHLDDLAHAHRLHAREREIVTRREADDPAGAGLGLGPQQAFGIDLVARVGAQGREVVGEDVGVCVFRVACTASSFVAGAKVAFRIVFRAVIGRRFLDLTLPRPFCAMWGYENVFTGEGIVTAVGMVSWIEGHSGFS
mgnify:CR=1 FL=1